MKLLISGATGLVGSALANAARQQGHEVLGLTRGPARAGEMIHWDPDAGHLEKSAVEGFDGIVHLAGDNIASGRWTESKKVRIRESRVKSTSLLATTIAGLAKPPRVFVSASAIGYYGDRGETTLDESSTPGDIYLSDVCRQWEEATRPAWAVTRVAQTRIGVVLSPDGGALAKMLTPFKLGVGGIVGNGRQYMSWIALPDVVAAILHVLRDDSLHGAINLVSPQPVTNRQFTKVLGQVLHRPTLLPMPAFAARLAFGQMADELLLASAKIYPKKLEAAHYSFQLPDLQQALQHLLA